MVLMEKKPTNPLWTKQWIPCGQNNEPSLWTKQWAPFVNVDYGDRHINWIETLLNCHQVVPCTSSYIVDSCSICSTML